MARGLFWLILVFTISSLSAHSGNDYLQMSPIPIVELYEIRGENIEGIREQLQGKGPIDRYGFRRDALTSWKIKYSWEKIREGSPKRSVSVENYVKVILPSLVTEDRELKSRWNKYIANVWVHELGHVKNAYFVSRQLERQLQKAVLVGKENRDLHEITRKTLASGTDFDLQYDRNTEHGKSQGAVW